MSSYLPPGYNFAAEIAQAHTDGYNEGHTAGHTAGYNQGLIDGKNPHFVLALSADQVLTSGDVIYTLDFDTALSQEGVSVSSSGIVTINSGSDGTWDFFVLFSWLMNSNHWAENAIFTRSYIYESSTQRAKGVARRRASGDFFGTCAAEWAGSVTVGDTFSARAEFDWDSTPDMTIFRNAPSTPSGGQIPNGQTNGGMTGAFGPAARFIGVKR